MALVLMDVDGTLYPGASSEALFIRHLILEGIIGPRQALAVASFAALHAPRYGRHVWKINKAYLAGLAPTLIAEEACRFVLAVLAGRITDVIRTRIEHHRRAADRIMLLTGTPNFLARPLADHLAIEIGAATVPHVLCDRFTSAPPLVHPFGPEKLRLACAIAQATGLDLAAAAAYADSGHDRLLLAAVRHPVAVDPDAQLRRCARAAGWEIVRSRSPAAPRLRRGQRRRDASVSP
jgi:phosphoserine phosphatase